MAIAGKRPPMRDLKKVVSFIENMQTPAVYYQHVHYINFAKFGQLQPVYINMIRDPIERFVSNYHFNRFGDHFANMDRMEDSNPQKEMNINDCILTNHTECNEWSAWYMAKYFCGQDRICSTPSTKGVELAKMHVRDNYLAVGVLEDFNATLKVFENLLPEYFEGATKLGLDIDMIDRNKLDATRWKSPLSPEAYLVLKKRMAHEYDLYNFVLSEFEYIKGKLNIV